MFLISFAFDSYFSIKPSNYHPKPSYLHRFISPGTVAISCSRSTSRDGFFFFFFQKKSKIEIPRTSPPPSHLTRQLSFFIHSCSSPTYHALFCTTPPCLSIQSPFLQKPVLFFFFFFFHLFFSSPTSSHSHPIE